MLSFIDHTPSGQPHNQGNLYPGACSRGQMPQIAPRRFAVRQTQCVAPRAHSALAPKWSIIQNGKLVGAVTHVLVANPTEGYDIFIENMLSAAQNQVQPKAA